VAPICDTPRLFSGGLVGKAKMDAGIDASVNDIVLRI
jgi:hypothetical protein